MQPVELTAIESKLRHGLMPVALSQSASSSIHAMLDELADEATDIPPVSIGSTSKQSPMWKAAAAIAGLIGVSAWLVPPFIEDAAFAFSSNNAFTMEAHTQTMYLVDESTRLAWVEDEGWLDDPDGGSLRAVRMRVIEENRLLDEETGIIVHVTSPREEMLFMPVNSF